MRIVACGLIVGAALLGAVPVAMTPVAMADDVTHGTAGASADSQATPQDEVSVLAVSLTAGGAIATAGSGVALALARRRKLSPPS